MECSVPCQSELISEDSVQISCNGDVDRENSNHSVEIVESDLKSGCQNPFEITNIDLQLKRLEIKNRVTRE